MMKHWRLILIALLAALLVCTCMSATAEGTGDHGGVTPHDPTHQSAVVERNYRWNPHHDSRAVGKNGGFGTLWYDLYCPLCGIEVEQNLHREAFEECTMQKVPGTYHAATCTSPETEDWKCIYCGYQETREYQKALGHDFEKKHQAATCDKAGYDKVVCNRCGLEQSSKTIPALGHIENGHYTVLEQLTCQLPGRIRVHCVRNQDSDGNPYTCNGYEKEIPARGHLHLETKWIVVQEPRCQQAGYKVNYCEYCGADPWRQEIPKVDHNFVEVSGSRVAAGCTTAGHYQVECSFGCGTKETRTISPTGHTPAKQWEYDRACATCTEAMNGVLKCSVCNAVLEKVTYPAKGHNFQIVRDKSTAATCTEDGYEYYVCENVFDDQFGVPHPCGEVKEVRVPATGHFYDVKVKEPTCTKNGSETSICSVCGDKQVKKLNALGHNYETKITPAACTEAGSEVTTCTRCGDVKESKELPALGHKPADAPVVAPATCTEDGKEEILCTVCGEVLDTKVLPATGHKPADAPVVTPATCTEDGKEEILCTVCGEVLDTKVLPATGHKPVTVVVKEATATENGKTRTECSVCGEVLGYGSIPAKGGAAAAPVIFNGTAYSAGVAASDLGAAGSNFVTPIDLSVDGEYAYSLVADGQYEIGKLFLTVSGGKLIVTYQVNDAANIFVAGESLVVYANGEALKNAAGSPAAFGAEIDLQGDAKIILAINLTVSFDVNGAGVSLYVPDQAQLEVMKGLVD